MQKKVGGLSIFPGLGELIDLDILDKVSNAVKTLKAT